MLSANWWKASHTWEQINGKQCQMFTWIFLTCLVLAVERATPNDLPGKTCCLSALNWEDCVCCSAEGSIIFLSASKSLNTRSRKGWTEDQNPSIQPNTHLRVSILLLETSCVGLKVTGNEKLFFPPHCVFRIGVFVFQVANKRLHLLLYFVSFLLPTSWYRALVQNPRSSCFSSSRSGQIVVMSAKHVSMMQWYKEVSGQNLRIWQEDFKRLVFCFFVLRKAIDLLIAAPTIILW